ncbi:MAG: hypothetical protein ACO24W_06800, partial [Candidatus Nanopelagicales bacterium]
SGCVRSKIILSKEAQAAMKFMNLKLLKPVSDLILGGFILEGKDRKGSKTVGFGFPCLRWESNARISIAMVRRI